MGNVILKLYEGLGPPLIKNGEGRHDVQSAQQDWRLLVKPAIKETLKSFDGSQYGGHPAGLTAWW